MEAERLLVTRIIELLNVLGLNQQAIAKRIGVQKAQVTHWKNGFRPIAPHHLDALHLLIREAINEDFDREDNATPHMKTPREHECYQLHKLARDDAFKAYEESVERWFEALQPGSGLRDVYAKADKSTEQIAPYLTRSSESWSTTDCLKLSFVLRELLNRISLINRLRPVGKFLEGLPGGGIDVGEENHGKHA